MFDDAIVCLGAGILGIKDDVRTTINQCRGKDSSAYYSLDGVNEVEVALGTAITESDRVKFQAITRSEFLAQGGAL